MSKNLRRASAISVAATVIVTLFTAAGSGIAAESRAPIAPPAAELPHSTPESAGATAEPGFDQLETQPVPAELTGQAPPAPASADEAHPAPVTAASLSELVAEQPVSDTISPELKCLASAIYFEARSESLPGQLAVGRVIVNRARSGRFPNSYCGVVYQPSQFSFVHGAGLRGVTNARMWHQAVAVAQIADSGTWQSQAEGALFFHAARVSPNWRLQRVARIDNHIFYR